MDWLTGALLTMAVGALLVLVFISILYVAYYLSVVRRIVGDE